MTTVTDPPTTSALVRKSQSVPSRTRRRQDSSDLIETLWKEKFP
jgi:hypothetical protein